MINGINPQRWSFQAMLLLKAYICLSKKYSGKSFTNIKQHTRIETEETLT